MMALKDMRRTSNCDNKRDNEKKMSDYKSIYDENNHAERQYFNKPTDYFN